MATQHAALDAVDSLAQTLRRMANEHANSEACNRLFSVPLTMARVRAVTMERRFFNLNRRDCWGAVSCNAPFEVKKLVWGHERDELIGNDERGAPDHITLRIREGAVYGLSEQDFLDLEPTAFTKTACNAWLNVAQHRPWLHAFSASSILELANSEAVVEGGSSSGRWAHHLQAKLGIPLKKQVSAVEHMEVDVEHGNLIFTVANAYATTDALRQQVIDGAVESLAIDKVFKVGLAELMESIKE